MHRVDESSPALPGDLPLASASSRGRLAGFLLVTAIQAGLCSLGYLLTTGAFGISPVWPAAGFGVAVAVVHGYRVLPALALGMTIADLAHGNPLPVALWLGLVVAAGAGVGAELVRRFVPRLGQAHADAADTIRFLLAAGVVATCVTALLGTWGLHAFGGLAAAEIAPTAWTWWLGDAVGVVTVAPFVLATLTPVRRREALARPGEMLGLVALTGAVVAASFTPEARALAPHVHVEFAVLPFLVWGALRFGLIGAATACLVMTAIATGATAIGLGPYGDGTIAQLHGLQFVLAVATATMLLLGITTSHKAHLRRQAQHESDFIRAIAENLPGAVFRRRLSADGYVSYPYMAGRFAREFGLDAGATDYALAGDADTTPPPGLRYIHGQDYQQLHQRLHRSAADLEPLEMELRFVRDDGEIRWARSISRPHRTAGGGVTWDGILLDVTAEKEQQAQAEYLARHDPLTGLLNRAGLHELIGPALSRARRQGHSVAVCLIDLDDFKEINDSRGHLAGDAVLRAVSERIRETMRLEDIKARLGGDEFIVIQTDVQDHGNAAHACRRLAERLHEPFELDGGPVRTGASMGVALFPDDVESEHALFVAADQAMYQAKRDDSGTVFYSAEMGTEVRARGELVHDLGSAIERRELEVYYQPQIHVPTGELSGVEALVRWRHPERGWISPGVFVPLAEERGLVGALDLLVLDQVLADVARWEQTHGFEFPVAVNLSGASLRDDAHRDRLARVIQDSGVPTARLELELTETTLVHAADQRVSDGLRALAALGVRFSADDFGTGYGSLTYLRALPITRIKIDRSFVQGAPSRTEDAEIVRALLQLAGNLGLQVIAEGVETRKELDTLNRLGCTYVQGFYFARPMPRDALVRFVHERGTLDLVAAFPGQVV